MLPRRQSGNTAECSHAYACAYAVISDCCTSKTDFINVITISDLIQSHSEKKYGNHLFFVNKGKIHIKYMHNMKWDLNKCCEINFMGRMLLSIGHNILDTLSKF